METINVSIIRKTLQELWMEYAAATTWYDQRGLLEEIAWLEDKLIIADTALPTRAGHD